LEAWTGFKDITLIKNSYQIAGGYQTEPCRS
jgi:hypothetical protein